MKRLKKANKGIFTFASILMLIGVAFFAMAIFYINRDLSFFKTAERVKAEVVESNVEELDFGRDEIDYVEVFVDYEYDGKEYKHIEVLKDAEIECEVGERIRVYIDPKEPTVAILEKRVYGQYGYMLAGIIFFLLASALYALAIWLWNKKSKIRKNGYRIQAEVTDICKSGSVEILGKSPNVIYCECFSAELNRKFEFKSVGVWNDLETYFSVGEYIEVAVNPNNWREYYVDIDKAWNIKKERYTL